MHPPAHRCAQRVPLRKAKRGKPNLPFAQRRGRVQAKRSTQGMHEIQRNNQTPFNSPLDINGEEKPNPILPILVQTM